MLNEIQQDSEIRMKKSLETFTQNIAKLRTGRAHPSILDSVSVLYYGNLTPLSQIANITVQDARTLKVSPWEKSMAQAIDKAIRASDLGLNPNSAGPDIFVPLPPLTEERRRDLVKHVKNDAEEVRIAIRNVRRDAMNQVKELEKSKSITEDEERRGEELIQKLTDKYVAEIDKLLTAKETELMNI